MIGRIETKGNKAIAFLLGLVYGYRGADLQLSVKPIEDFCAEMHKDDIVYYLNRRSGETYQELREEVTHVCVLREDKINGKVCIFIYKRK
ncbi:MAG: hypothetical protein NZ851_03525 [Aquificaceae bacterium]|nr:hypothetical protein [Aquificaceae bacterium]